MCKEVSWLQYRETSIARLFLSAVHQSWFGSNQVEFTSSVRHTLGFENGFEEHDMGNVFRDE